MKFLTFGEILLRLKSPGYQVLFQTPSLEATFGGAEANVAVSLANFGMDAAFLTVLPDNAVGDACIRELRSFGVDTSRILRADGRMGLYFLQSGSNQRPTDVVYDRANSAMALAQPGCIDWDEAFSDIGWFHLSGITPAVSVSAMQLSLESAKEAKQRGITVSCDLNYRGKLWKYGKQPAEIMSEITSYSDVIIASEEDLEKCLGFSAAPEFSSGAFDRDRYRSLSEQVLEAFPNVKMVAVMLYDGHSADWSSWAACLNDREAFRFSKQYEIRDIVDRVGIGDSFAAGLIYGLNTFDDHQKALEFAEAASCLKHSIPGDFNRVSTADVEKLMGGDGTGRVQR